MQGRMCEELGFELRAAMTLTSQGLEQSKGRSSLAAPLVP